MSTPTAKPHPAAGRPEGYPDTPELDKMLAAQERSQVAGEFLDWLLSEAGYSLTNGYDRYGRPLGGHPGIEQLLADWLGIDRDQIERERRAALAWVREQNQKENQE